MQISAPFGYREIVPFLKTHKVRLPAAGEIPEFVQRSNALPVSHTEFQLVAREYPIVFTTGDGGKTFATVAVTGITDGENLFVQNGAWTPGVYVPAYARRYPFCMAVMRREGADQNERLICIEKAFIDDAGEAMFEAGKATKKWSDIENLLSEYEADLQRSRDMCAILGDYGLLEPFTMQATLAKEKGGNSMHITGMYRVSEKNLENLNAAQLKNLLRKGLMARVYLHLLSLENFARLLERKGARAAPAA